MTFNTVDTESPPVDVLHGAGISPHFVLYSTLYGTAHRIGRPASGDP